MGRAAPVPPLWDGTLPAGSCSGWGLPCRSGHPDRGALLPHRFTLASWRRCRRPVAVYFLWHCPSTRADWPLASTLPFGARTFLPLPRAAAAGVHPGHSGRTGLSRRRRGRHPTTLDGPSGPPGATGAAVPRRPPMRGGAELRRRAAAQRALPARELRGAGDRGARGPGPSPRRTRHGSTPGG